ncbi:Hydroxylamine oxidoreductase (Fragment) [hydrothermal vent metagenome]|uniref:Hydroxylamine oxidoreductase n=1 Tax=hydrothermal vent metagenome TaxID=652676 RepID=A0A3B1BIS8_9ZZZZ
MKEKKVRYIWIPIIVALIALLVGFYYVNWSKSGAGAGLYSRDWLPDAIFAYWNPDDFYESVKTVPGVFNGEECVSCHTAVTPGIVNDWRKSRHSQADKKVYCADCHGNDHQNLHMPTPTVCATCHKTQHREFVDEKRFGFPSHALAMERALDAKHFVDKPKAEVTACLQCHSIATKCDSCHTRHRFSAAEARRPEACISCHSGPPHPDDETYFNSAHGQIYLKEGSDWDWSKPLRKGNYKAPTCAYCHMDEGKHQVADKSIWGFGIKQVNPLSSGNEVKRNKWVKLCSDCHEPDWARQKLSEMDVERKRAWKKLYAAEKILKTLRTNKQLHPDINHRPPYPGDRENSLLQRERIGFFDGQASAFYNVSPIERDYFEMWYFDNLGAYKGAAHGDAEFVRKGHAAMDAALKNIRRNADVLRMLDEAEQEAGIKAETKAFWKQGEYTDFNREQN